MNVARFEHVSEGQYAQDTTALSPALPLREIPLPRRATAGSAGYDFVCPIEVTLEPGESVTIPTGIRCVMEAGWVLLLFPRSSLGFRHEVRLSNTVGVIDSDYSGAKNEGHILVRLHNGGDHPVTLRPGERFCQGVLLPHGTAGDEDITAARSGGFGSTGR